MSEIKNEVRTFLQKYGVDIVGFTEIPSGLRISEITEDFPRAIVFGYPLSRAVLNTIENQPTLIYKHHYKTVNWLLDQTAFHLVRFITQKAKRAIAIPASQIVDWKNQRGHLPHKILAREAGLGFIGKNGLVVHPEYGAQVRYASVLTDLEFESDQRLEQTCRDCQRCIAVCPAQAISKDGLNLNRCFDKLKEFSRIRGIGQYICGVCLKVCDGSH